MPAVQDEQRSVLIAALAASAPKAQTCTSSNEYSGVLLGWGTIYAMGNRVTERATDSGGTLVKNIPRTIDELNRVQQVVGAQ